MKSNVLKRVGVLLAIIILACGLVACGKKNKEEAVEEVPVQEDSTAVEDVTEEAGEETTDAEPEVVPEGMYRSELTNEIIDEKLKDQRPIAVMVDNEVIALPHYGLTQADVVYEMMNSTKNDRITRFMVLVKDWEAIKQLGSIRSLRPTNILIASEWNAVLCHDGGPFYNDPYLAKEYVNNFSGTFSRVNNGKPREYTEYVLEGDLEKNFSNSKVSREYTQFYPGAHYQFADKANPITLEENSDAIVAKDIVLPFSHNKSRLKYNETSGEYDYYEYGEPHLDAGNGDKQLRFKNVLIQSCTFAQYDENGYMIFNCIDQGKEGYYITNGKAIPVTWKKMSETDVTRYYDKDGKEITINTGKTYVGFVPNDDWSKLDIK